MFIKPAFFIIGERKCGTSSLYRYLLDHPNVLPCQKKEPQFFTQPPWYIWWNIKKYYALFPKLGNQGSVTLNWPELDAEGQLYQESVEFLQKPGQTYITGEASANTFYSAHPRIVKHFLPEVKLILLLRNPVDRAFSHYRMLERFNREGKNVGRISGFALDMQWEMDRVRKGRKARVLSPGLYVQRLPAWIRVFGRDHLFIIRTEDLDKKKKAKKIMRDLCQFLELPAWDFSATLQTRYNQAPAEQMSNEIREILHFFYKPYNQALEDLLGRKMNWD